MTERRDPILLAMDQVVQDQEIADGPRQYMGLSSVGYCLRQTYLKWDPRFPYQESTESLRLFADGHLHEDAICRQLDQAGYCVYDRGRPVGWPGHDALIQGHIDGIILDHGRPLLLEIKSIRAVRVASLAEGVEQAWPHYFMQVQAYLHALQAERLHLVPGWHHQPTPGLIPLDVDGPVAAALMIFKDRTDGVLFSERVEYAPSAVAGLATRLAVLAQAAQTKVPPSAEYDYRKDWHCKSTYCAVRAHCLNLG